MREAKAGNTSIKILIGLAALAACLVFGLLITKWFVRPNETVRTSQGIKPGDVEEISSSAARGEATAQFRLGSLYAKGLSVTQSYTMAAKWYQLAADQGQAGAQLAIGELYEVGQGVPRDETNAARWYRLAAEQGSPGAQYSLAALYVMGKGVTADDAEALKWYRLAAEQGYGLSQYNLGMRYYEGRGVAADPVQAYQWLSLAAAQQLPDAAQTLTQLKRTMTREQTIVAQRRVAEFAPKSTTQTNR